MVAGYSRVHVYGMHLYLRLDRIVQNVVSSTGNAQNRIAILDSQFFDIYSRVFPGPAVDVSCKERTCIRPYSTDSSEDCSYFETPCALPVPYKANATVEASHVSHSDDIFSDFK
jgi:hypothetical protein